MSKASGRRLWKLIAIGLTACVLTLVIGVYFKVAPRFNTEIANLGLFHPFKLKEHPPEMAEIAGIKAEEVSIKSDNFDLNGLFYKSPKSDDVILLNHGNGGPLDLRRGKIEALLKINFSVLAYDYRGYGKSTGEPSLEGVVTDGVAAFDYLVKQKHYPPASIIIYGESLGTGVSTAVARKRDCRALILESAFKSPESLAKEKMPALNIYPSFLWFDPVLDNLSYARQKHPPILLIAGQLDTTIPCHHSKTIYAEGTSPQTLVIAPNSNHIEFGTPDWGKDIALFQSKITEFARSCQPLAGAQ